MRRRGVLAAPVVVLLAAVLVACAPRATPAQQSATLTETGRLHTELGMLPGVASASVAQSQDAFRVSSVTVTVQLAGDLPQADVDTIDDSVVRAVWLSRIQPLDAISVSVASPGQAPTYRDVVVSDEATAASLTAQYGPRPG